MNNRKFTEDDIKGIRDLGRGAKFDSTEKIGKFGLGFNVAYHVTDCPSFLSCGREGTPENLCVFDPTLCYINKRGKELPGRRWKLEPKHVADFSDQFKPYLLKDVIGSSLLRDLETGYTVFRLPLTRSEHNRNTKLFKGEKFSVSDIEELLTVFMQSSKDVLLFLNNIKSISAIEIKGNGQHIHRFTTSSSIPPKYADDCTEFLKASTECTTQVKRGIQPQPLSLFHRLDILQQMEGGHLHKESWLLQKAVCGNFKLTELQLALTEHGLRAVGGVAAPLATSTSQRRRLFCYLPTPLETQLPVHINGHFVVDDSRKHLEAKKIFGKGYSDWNILLVEKVIVPAYIKLIINAKNCCMDEQQSDVFKKLYQLFPRTDESYSEIEMDISATFYRGIKGNLPLLYTEGKNRCWVSFDQANFYLPMYTLGKNIFYVSHKLMEVVVELGMNVVDSPHIYNGFSSVERHFHILNQSLVVQFLASIDIQNDGIKSMIKENLSCLIKFCINKVKDVPNTMERVPLMLCADGSLQKLAKVFPFKYSQLLPSCLSSIVDKEFGNSELGKVLAKCEVISEPSLQYIGQHINIITSREPCILAREQAELLPLLWEIIHERMQNERLCGEIVCKNFKTKPILRTKGGRVYPMCLSKSVIGHPRKSTCELLFKLGYDTIHPDDHDSYLIPIVTFSSNEDLVPCFKLFEPRNCDVVLSNDEVKVLLTSLADCDVNELTAISHVLLRLKIYWHADDKRFVSVGSEKSVCIVPSALPKDGLDILQNYMPAIIFLKEPESSTAKLYDTIFHTCSDVRMHTIDIYLDYIIPNLSKMSTPQIIAHVDYIIQSEEYLSCPKVFTSLKEIPFVECNEKLVLVKGLYDPRNKLFETFRCDCLPSKEWQTAQRLAFLCNIGLCKSVTMAEWISHAKRFASLLTTPLIVLSEALYDELLIVLSSYKDDPSLDEFLSEVAEISFMYSTTFCYGPLLSKAWKMQPKLVMVKFSQSVMHHNAALAFNVCSILPEKCDQIPKWKALKVENPIKTETVIKNLKYLCEGISSHLVSSYNYSAASMKELSSICNDHYKYLDSVGLSPESVTVLRGFACIMIVREDLPFKVVKVTQVVEQLPSLLLLEPFCYRLPPHIAQHSNLTKALGIRKELMAQDYGDILTDVSNVTDRDLVRDEVAREAARCAYHELIRCLRQKVGSEELLRDGYDGFLLSQDYELLSRDLLYDDVPWYAQRIPHNSYKYILSPVIDQQGSRKPPELLNVHFLSEVVKERIHDNCKSNDALCTADVLYSQNKREERCNFSRKISESLSSFQFAEGMFRIYYADHACPPPISFQKAVWSFKQFEVTCLQTVLTTVLYYSHDDSTIPGSDDLTTLSTLIRDEGILFISPHGQDFDVTTLFRHISSQLNLALNNAIKNEKNIAALFEYEPEGISLGLTKFHRIPEFSLDNEEHDFNRVGDVLSLTALTVQDAIITVNFKREEKVRYYSPIGELVLAKVMKSHNNLNGKKITSRCIEIVTEDSEEENMGLNSILVSPFEIFKVLTMPQIKGLQKNEISPFASPLIVAAVPCESAAQISQWFKDFFLSDDLLMYSGLLISLVKIRLVAQLHYQFLVKDITSEMFGKAIFELLHCSANEQLPCTQIDATSDLGKELSILTMAMEELSLGDEGAEKDQLDVFGTRMIEPSLGCKAAGPSKQTVNDLDRYLLNAIRKKELPPNHVQSGSTSSIAASSHSRAVGTHKVAGKPPMAPPTGRAYSRFTNPTHRTPQLRSRFEPTPPKVVKQPPICKERARAWLEQARVDYKAAQDILQVPVSDGDKDSTKRCQYPALVCFLCHDVVEKCLKGLLYTYVEDVKCNTMNCSNLVLLVQQFKDKASKVSLHEVCNDTVMVVNVYESKSRYPHFHNPPCAPAAVYLHKDAVEAFSAVSTLMKMLQGDQIVRELLGDLAIIPKPRFISAMKSTTSEGKSVPTVIGSMFNFVSF